MKTPVTVEQKRVKQLARQKKYYEKNRTVILANIKKKKTAVNTENEVWYDSRIITDYFKTLSSSGKKITETSVNNHISDLTIIFRAYNLTERDCLMKYIMKNVATRIVGNLELVESSRFKRPYSISSVISFIHTLLLAFNVFEIKNEAARELLEKKKYDIGYRLMILKNKFDTYTEEKKLNEIVLYWPDLEKRIKDHFKENSKENLIIQLYNTIGARDDFSLKKVTSKEETKDKDQNYIVIPENKTKRVSIILNHYKTRATYGIQDRPMNKYASKLVRSFVANRTSETHLFPEKTLSYTIGQMLKKVGIAGASVNYLRRSICSSIPELKTKQEQLDFARFMMHSVDTQQKNYRVCLMKD